MVRGKGTQASYSGHIQVGRDQSCHSYFWILKGPRKGACLQRTKEEALPKTPVSQMVR